MSDPRSSGRSAAPGDRPAIGPVRSAWHRALIYFGLASDPTADDAGPPLTWGIVATMWATFLVVCTLVFGFLARLFDAPLTLAGILRDGILFGVGMATVLVVAQVVERRRRLRAGARQDRRGGPRA